MCCVIIPIHKSELNEYEMVSLRQCCRILEKHPVIFVTYKELDCVQYTSICQNSNVSFRYEYFDNKYFTDIAGYNALLLSRNFYVRFKNYEYMLIYQLDAYVFRDELEYWCKKGYDYIGAPWIKLNKSKIKPEFKAPLSVGNGGFSLRNINSFIKAFDVRIYTLYFLNIVSSFYNNLVSKYSRKYYAIFIPAFFLSLFLKITKKIFFNSNNINEDLVWSFVFMKKKTTPPPDEAIYFSIENYPEYYYKLNNSQLPFGCHDWYKYYNYLFFKEYIPLIQK